MMIQSGLESSVVSITKTCLIEIYQCMALKLPENNVTGTNFKNTIYNELKA